MENAPFAFSIAKFSSCTFYSRPVRAISPKWGVPKIVQNDAILDEAMLSMVTDCDRVVRLTCLSSPLSSARPNVSSSCLKYAYELQHSCAAVQWLLWLYPIPQGAPAHAFAPSQDLVKLR